MFSSASKNRRQMLEAKGRATVIALALFAMGLCAVPSAVHAQALSKLEQNCSSKLGKTAAKISKLAAKSIAKCRERDIVGPDAATCPDTTTTAKLGKLEAKMRKLASKKCGSVCSVSSSITCLTNDACPPINSAQENCTAGAANKPFDMRSFGFPGPFCESVLGHEIATADDLADCVSLVTEDVTDELMDVIYGTLGTGSLDSATGKCLSTISKSVQKLVSFARKGVGKCRDDINKGKVSGNPATCSFDDKKLAAKLLKFEDKLRSKVEGSCAPGDIAQLDICLAGVGGTTTVEDAGDCLVEAAREVADSNLPPASRSYATVSLIDAAYPPPPRCGDDVVNQLPNPLLLLGEECDGVDDAACPGECLPAGDVFECTCSNIPRVRLFADASQTESDAGWGGDSHEQTLSDLSGWINELSNCDCDSFTDATCTGSSVDSVCDASGYQLPTCTWDLFSSTRCDQHGNTDGRDTNLDCQICDSLSANPGDFCVNESQCQSQCYPNGGGGPTGPCSKQTDCGADETCRGRCDKSQECYIVPNGAPLPVSQGGAAVCAVQRYRDNVIGTRDIVTGQHELSWKLFSIIHLGENNNRPCPVCGGFCVGGTKGASADLCNGRCSETGDLCLFDSDCPSGELCSPDSPDCPGGFCQLSQVCGAVASTPGVGNACTIEYIHPIFGNMSNDCLPNPGANITGDGFEVDPLPATDHLISLPAAVPCTFPGFELLDCHCPDDGGALTQPNRCAPACNAGAELGTGCATGVGSGIGTTCSAGANAGKLCDEDSDCPGGLCNVNPTHCVGDAAFELNPCATNAECGAGTCVDACPSGRCLPLCVPLGGDPDDGICAAGPPTYHCEGPNLFFLSCSKSAAQASCSATCSVSATPCTKQADCPLNETCQGSCPQAVGCEAGVDGTIGNQDDKKNSGLCVSDVRNCYLDPLTSEGGSTLNGLGDPTNYFTVYDWCFGATTAPSINEVAGFGGPGRVRMHGLNVMNTDSIP